MEEKKGDNNSQGLIQQDVARVRLKKFEEVVSNILMDALSSSSSLSSKNDNILPCYLPLPKLDDDRIKLVSEAIVHHHYNTSNSQKNCNNNMETETIPPPQWPFDILPQAACIRCSATKINNRATGKLSGPRALRKEQQLTSIMKCVFAMLPLSALGPVHDIKDKNHILSPPLISSSSPEREEIEAVAPTNEIKKGERIRIVDFAGGTGHLALPLALLLPKCEIVLVDLKAASLELVHQKAKELVTQAKSQSTTTRKGNAENENMNAHHIQDPLVPNDDINNGKKRKSKRPKAPISSKDIYDTPHTNMTRQCEHIPNLYTFHGSISAYVEYNNRFDIGMALHACGEATDIVLRACGESATNNKTKSSFIVCPCCVGKLNRQKQNPYIYHATSGNAPTISYPQSTTFCRSIPSSESFDILSKAADYSVMQDMRTCRNASRRTAKSLLEMDRLLFMKETYGYDNIVLTRMDPWEASPKHDLLLGWMDKDKNNENEEGAVGDPYEILTGGVHYIEPCSECNADIMMTMQQLFTKDASSQIDSFYFPTYPKQVMKINQNENKSNAFPGKFISGGAVYWTEEEEKEYSKILEEFVSCDKTTTKRFPIGMGARLRKLVHFLAYEKRLRHWSEGRKKSEKIVVVSKQSSDLSSK